MMTLRILILGGTTEARELASSLADCLARGKDLAVMLSLAGRTINPVAQPVPVRTGGFGGAQGLADYLRDNAVSLLVDATHPFAARISANAVIAAQHAGIRLLTLRRAEWRATGGDDWTFVDSVADAIGALGIAPRRVFAALGRQELAPLETARQHFYLIRSVDPVVPKPALPTAEYILDRGPFDFDKECGLFDAHRIDAVLAKNSGGSATYAKLVAARALNIPVFMVRRPPIAAGDMVESVEQGLAAIDHLLPPFEKRGE